ncbi:MAG: type II secretion system F family protein, partial [Candidatus Peregrinibacteria bacterium]|nr:type II secretion system F family protein [Candidatus Peregrinibacteria bacterium]
KFLKPFWHRVALRLPVFGKLLIYVNLARFSRTMNSLLQAGIPITESLDIVKSMIGNSVYRRAIEQARDKVEQGGKLGESFLEEERLFPPLVSKMIFIGEKTGSLEKTTDHLAKLYENNVDSITKNLTVLLEPLLLVFMGVLIGGVAVSIILPIYQLPSLITR